MTKTPKLVPHHAQLKEPAAPTDPAEGKKLAAAIDEANRQLMRGMGERTDKEIAAIIGPAILIRRTANGYLVDTDPPGLHRDPMTATISSARAFESLYSFESFTSLAAWLADRFAHRVTP